MTTNVVASGYNRASHRERTVVVPMITTAHHTAHPTCRLGMAAQSLTTELLLAATVPSTWCTTAESTIPGMTSRGGATGYSQNTDSDPMLARTSADR
ncbi:MAG: hypothetical protein ABJA87_01105 [bacterium]